MNIFIAIAIMELEFTYCPMMYSIYAVKCCQKHACTSFVVNV